MTEKRFSETERNCYYTSLVFDNQTQEELGTPKVVVLLNELAEENEHLKKQLKRCKDWINSDKYDYEITLSFIKNKGYSLKDVLEYEKELKE